MVKKLVCSLAMLLAAILPSAAQALTTGTEIYGYLSYYPDSSGALDRLGWYSIGTNGALSLCWLTPEDELGNGFLANGKLYTYNEMNIMGESYGLTFSLLNFETGATEQTFNFDSSKGFYGFDSMCYIPDENVAYGYARTDYYASGMGCEQAFCRIDVSNPTNITIVKKVGSSIDRCISLALNPDDGKMYGITRFGVLVTVAPDGTQTTVGQLQLLDGTSPSGLSAGLVYDSAKHVFIWNALEKGSTRDSYAASYLYTLDPKTLAMGRVCTFKDNESFSFFVVAEKAATGTPGKARINSNTFAGTPSLSGSVNVTFPTEYADGSAIAASTGLTLTAKVDDNVVSTVEGKAGQTVDVAFTALTQGMRTLSFNVSAGAETGAASVLSLYVGNDTPKAPTDVRFNAIGINWKASAGSEHGGYVDETKVTYTVAVDGTDVASGITGTSYAYKVPEGPMSVHTASVRAVFAGLESAPAESNGYVSGSALQLPLSFVPTADESLLFTLYDGNRDGNGWRFSEPYWGDPYFVFQANGKAGDDWIFLPAAVFDRTDMIYSLTFDARRGDSNVPEKVDAYLATAPEPNSVIKEIMAETGPATYDFAPLTSEFTIPEAGTYYVGIHACGGTDAYFLFVNHFNVKAVRSAGSAPSSVTDLTAVAKPEGELAVTVSFRMPTLTTTGEAIAAGTQLTATVSTSAASVELTGTPGQQCTTEIAILDGTNTVTVQVTDGSLIGELASIDVYGGLDNPYCVENLVASLSEDNLAAYLHWDAATAGEHGGYVKPDGVKYWLVTYATTEYAEYPVKDREIGTDVFDYTYTVPEGTTLQTVRLGILAENEMGDAEYFASLSITMGVPYNLPMDEMFAGRDLRYKPVTVGGDTEDYDAYWGIDDPAIFGDAYANMSGKALMATPDRPTSKGRVSLPKFKVGPASADLTFSFYADSRMPATKILAQTAGMVDPVEIATLSPAGKSGWTQETFSLPADFNAKGWVGVFIEVEFSSLSQFLLVERYKFDEGTGSGIEEIAGGAYIGCEGGNIVYSGLNGTALVYKLDGVLAGRLEGGSGSLALPAGIYLIQHDGVTSKVCIR